MLDLKLDKFMPFEVIVRVRREYESMRLVRFAVKVNAGLFCRQRVVNRFNVRQAYARGSFYALGLLLNSRRPVTADPLAKKAIRHYRVSVAVRSDRYFDNFPRCGRAFSRDLRCRLYAEFDERTFCCDPLLRHNQSRICAISAQTIPSGFTISSTVNPLSIPSAQSALTEYARAHFNFSSGTPPSRINSVAVSIESCTSCFFLRVATVITHFIENFINFVLHG